MEDLLQQVEAYKKQIEIYNIEDGHSLEEFRIKFLGSKGVLKQLFSELKSVPTEKKREYGLRLNELKILAENKFESFKDSVFSPLKGLRRTIDHSLPGELIPIGSRHPITLVRNKIVAIFQRLGFAVADGPEIEDDWHNFTALNLPENHPARDMQDTFYISQNPDWLLRTHTSNVQIREMEKHQLPIRIICPGRVYRNETISARSHCFFHQVEGLYIDKDVSFADLKQTLYFFVREMFGENVKTRFRPSYFPFTEPSAEMDVTCFICEGKGCRICKHTGWVEILGCGMVHPQVLENCGIDHSTYSGFAFGMGVERPAMLLYDVNDIRHFSENDVRLLKQFETAN